MSNHQERIIEINNLRYSYPDGTSALSGITLDVFEGISLGIIGSNGAGKSTLLLHLIGILKGDGFIKILGLDMTDKNLSIIRSKVGLVFQDPENQLFMPTIFDDVSFGPINMGLNKSDVEASVNRALKQVDLLSFTHRSPHHLSIGEKKRAAIATVLSMDPRILILDEPSSNLDPKHRRDLIGLLNNLTQTKIIATHDLNLVRETCSAVALMYRGKIAAQGSAQAILDNRELLEQYDMSA
ncbi:MAG: energy-coupling factor ABC transporter ATP-binding protein [Syntrophales bacterium]